MHEVRQFLQACRTRWARHGIVFVEREKNLQALLDLELLPEHREAILQELPLAGYIKGPKPDTVLEGANYWEFGVPVNGREVYVKLSLGPEDGPVVCLSFHPAERTMRYHGWTENEGAVAHTVSWKTSF